MDESSEAAQDHQPPNKEQVDQLSAERSHGGGEELQSHGEGTQGLFVIDRMSNSVSGPQPSSCQWSVLSLWTCYNEDEG